METRHSGDEMEIDLREIFFALKKKIWWILATGLLLGCAAGAYSQIFIEPTYTSTSSMLVLSKEETLSSMSDFQLGTQLASDYQVVIKSTPVMKQVIENLGLNMNTGALQSSIRIENPSNTRILKLSVASRNPELAKEIVDELASVSVEYIGDKMEVVAPKIVEEGQIPTYKDGPNVKKNALLGLMVGFIISGGLVCLLTVLNDSIKTEDDIERYLGISTLATIPDRKDYIGGKKSKKKRKKKKAREGR